MPRIASHGPDDPPSDAALNYWERSKRPLQILVFLLPLVVFYELAMLSALRSEETTYTNLAHKSLLTFFDAFGIHASGWYLPGLALVAVLLVWQILSREAWAIRVPALGLMVVESAALALPLFALGQVASRIDQVPIGVNLGPGSPDVGTFGVLGRVAFSIGAGLYEELLFRMALMNVIHVLVVDIAKHSHRLGVWAGVIVSAALFTVYHWVGAEAGSVSLAVSAFYFAAGLYFGLLFAIRGFGIVVAVHAVYDVVTASFLTA